MASPSRQTHLRHKSERPPASAGGLFSRNRTSGAVHLWKCCQAAQPWAGSNELYALHYCGSCGDGCNARVACCGLRAQRTQPTSGKPCTGNHELRPATIQANSNVRGRRHRGMTQCTRTVAIQPDFCRYDRQSGRLALGADHFHTSGDPKRTELPNKDSRE